MSSNPSFSQYSFNRGPSVALDRAGVGWTVPAGYPWLDVEIGGGMAAAYNHRVHMDSEDMPAMHLVDVANGVNALGFVGLDADSIGPVCVLPAETCRSVLWPRCR